MTGYGDIMDAFFGGQKPQGADAVADMRKRAAEKREAEANAARSAKPLPQMRAKTVDGVKYLRAEDVAEALKVTQSWSRVYMHITKWLAR